MERNSLLDPCSSCLLARLDLSTTHEEMNPSLLKYLLIVLALVSLPTTTLVQAEETPVSVAIYSIGDSTMSDKATDTGTPEWGWCQALKGMVAEKVRFENHAVNGRSTKSFIGEGRWDAVKSKLKPGDWVLIQFGHNDQKIKSPERYTNPYSTYRYNLEKFIRESKELGAHPLLMSSIVRRNFNEHGTLEDTHGAYPWVARQLAREQDVPFVDMQILTENTILDLGQEESEKLHLIFEPGEHPYFPDGRKDNTHLSELGAHTYAKLFLDDIAAQQLELSKLFE